LFPLLPRQRKKEKRTRPATCYGNIRGKIPKRRKKPIYHIYLLFSILMRKGRRGDLATPIFLAESPCEERRGERMGWRGCPRLFVACGVHKPVKEKKGRGRKEKP